MLHQPKLEAQVLRFCALKVAKQKSKAPKDQPLAKKEQV
jgi:hypothetical protein